MKLTAKKKMLRALYKMLSSRKYYASVLFRMNLTENQEINSVIACDGEHLFYSSKVEDVGIDQVVYMLKQIALRISLAHHARLREIVDMNVSENEKQEVLEKMELAQLLTVNTILAEFEYTNTVDRFISMEAGYVPGRSEGFGHLNMLKSLNYYWNAVNDDDSSAKGKESNQKGNQKGNQEGGNQEGGNQESNKQGGDKQKDDEQGNGDGRQESKLFSNQARILPSNESPEKAKMSSDMLLQQGFQCEKNAGNQNNVAMHKVLDYLGRELKPLPLDYRRALQFFLKKPMLQPSYKHINRRRVFDDGIIMPSQKSDVIRKVLCYIDVSGSMRDDTVKMIMDEIKNLLIEIHNIEIHVYQFTTRVINKSELVLSRHSDQEITERLGAGGTSFLPVYNHAEGLARNGDVCGVVVFSDTENNDSVKMQKINPPQVPWMMVSTAYYDRQMSGRFINKDSMVSSVSDLDIHSKKTIELHHKNLPRWMQLSCIYANSSLQTNKI